MSLVEKLKEDPRYHEALKACISCGVCTSVCPAAEFYPYSPRQLMLLVQTDDEQKIEELLKSDFIWYCGQCMSCKTRCPRNNIPGTMINVLRKVSQITGLFVESRMGRQQLIIKRGVGENILKYGYCIHPEVVNPETHPEQGPIWEWVWENRKEVYERLNANLDKSGEGTLRKISEETMNELHKIFEITGAKEFFEKIEFYSKQKAKQHNIDLRDDNVDEFVNLNSNN